MKIIQLKIKIKIENFVFCSDIKHEIDLKNIALKIDTKYDLKEYPGIIYRNDNPKFVAMIFRTGKFNVTSLKDFKDIQKTIKIINNLIKS